MKLRNLIPAIAAAGLVVAPVAVQAGTVASAAMPKMSTKGVAARKSTVVARDESLKPGLLIALILAGGAAAYGLSKAVDNNKSNGGN